MGRWTLERLGQCLAEHDAAILDRVVEVDVEVALGLELDVDQGVAGKLLEHVIEEADAGRDIVGACPIEVEARGDARFLGLAVDRGPAGR